MPVVQDSFFIPDDLAVGLATGLYKRFGSVIRYASGPNKGQIVKHLKPISLNTASEMRGAKTIRFVKQHKKGIIFAAIGVVATSAGVWAYNTVKNYEPKEVIEFRTALQVYTDAIRSGNMNIDIINRLMTASKNLKNCNDYKKVIVLLNAEELEVLVGYIYAYTVKLAKDNGAEPPEEEPNTFKINSPDSIINLQNYLNTQETIFEETA